MYNFSNIQSVYSFIIINRFCVKVHLTCLIIMKRFCVLLFQFNCEETKLNKVFCGFVSSGTLMLQLDGFPTGDGVKVIITIIIIYLISINYNN